jgi:hypothetical protein
MNEKDCMGIDVVVGAWSRGRENSKLAVREDSELF